jgi:hypothetical protein
VFFQNLLQKKSQFIKERKNYDFSFLKKAKKGDLGPYQNKKNRKIAKKKIFFFRGGILCRVRI